MTKLKCWKKTDKGYWEKGNTGLFVTKGANRFRGYWFVGTQSLRTLKTKHIRKEPFETESSATKFAKSYMKKHDMCKL